MSLSDLTPQEVYNILAGEIRKSCPDKPCVKFKPTDETSSVTSSRIGGEPYLPVGTTSVPHDSSYKPMILLLQLNFAEIPHVTGFPRGGMLQMFISRADDLYGLDLSEQDKQKNWRAVWIDEELVIADDTPATEYPDGTYDMTPIDHMHALSFSNPSMAPATSSAGAFYHLFDEELLNEVFGDAEKWAEPGCEDDWDVSDIELIDDEVEGFIDYLDELPSFGSQIGGYPSFTQEDPRDGHDDREIVLFQLDSEGGLMWGDNGIAQLFISERDLRELNFDRVMYNWDCY